MRGELAIRRKKLKVSVGGDGSTTGGFEEQGETETRATQNHDDAMASRVRVLLAQASFLFLSAGRSCTPGSEVSGRRV